MKSLYNTLTLSPKLIYSLGSCALQVLLILFLTIITKNITIPTLLVNHQQYFCFLKKTKSYISPSWLVGWSLMFFYSTNMAISEMKCQGWRVIRTQWRTTPHHIRFKALFLGPPGWAGARREKNLWALWCKGRLTEADTLTIWLGATPSGLTSAHLHHSPSFLQAGCPSCNPTNIVKALKALKWRKASNILTSTLATILFSSHKKRERDQEAHLNYHARTYNTERQQSHHKTKQNQIQQKTSMHL